MAMRSPRPTPNDFSPVAARAARASRAAVASRRSPLITSPIALLPTALAYAHSIRTTPGGRSGRVLAEVFDGPCVRALIHGAAPKRCASFPSGASHERDRGCGQTPAGRRLSEDSGQRRALSRRLQVLELWPGLPRDPPVVRRLPQARYAEGL